MKTVYKIITTLTVLIWFFPSAQIDQYYNYVRPGTKTVSPTSSFNAAVAAQNLKEGNATIKGIVVLKAKKRTGTNIKQEIYLFPATPYFEEFLSLKKKNKKKKVVTNEEFLSAKRSAKINDETGKFIFSNVKPGNYYLYTELYLLGSKSGSFKVGNQQWGIYNSGGNRVGGYTTPIYENKTWMTSKLNIIYKDVSVSDNQQIINIEL